MDGLRLPTNDVPAVKADELEANAAKYWDIFYRHNANKWVPSTRAGPGARASASMHGRMQHGERERKRQPPPHPQPNPTPHNLPTIMPTTTHTGSTRTGTTLTASGRSCWRRAGM